MNVCSEFETHAPPSSRTLRTRLSLWLSGFYQWFPVSFLKWSSDFCVSACFQDPLPWVSTPRTWARGWISKCDPLLESGFHFHPPSGPPGLFHWVHAEKNHNWNPTQPTDQHWYLLRPPTASVSSPQASSYAWALASITRQEAHVHSWSPFHHLISHEILPFFFWFKVPDLLLGNHCSYTVSLHPLLSRWNSASYGCQVNLSKAQVWSHHSLALKSSVAP